jgi:hypothetical protein
MKLPAIRPGYQKTLAKSLVMSLSKRPAIKRLAGMARSCTGKIIVVFNVNLNRNAS